LRINLVAVPLLKYRPEKLLAFHQHVSVTFTQLLKQARGTLNIGEEQCNGSAWQVRHADLLVL
jgi:hypothetical protein